MSFITPLSYCAPENQPKYYPTFALYGWVVMEREWLPPQMHHKIHSTHPTKEEAEAVALALNALSK